MHALGVVHHDAGIVGPQVPRQHGGERDGGRGSERQQKRRGHPAPAAHPRRRRGGGAVVRARWTTELVHPDDRAQGRRGGDRHDGEAEEALPLRHAGVGRLVFDDRYKASRQAQVK